MKKNLIVNLIVAVILVAGLIWAYNYQMKNFNNLTAQKEAEIKKNAVIEEISKSEKKIFAYKRILSKKEISNLMNSINALAGKNKIKIMTVQPQNDEVEEYYIKQTIRLEVEFKSYHNLGNFISGLEKSPEIFIVNNLDIISLRDSAGGVGLRANLMISTFIYKE